MTASIDEDTVDFKPNYDSRELEPTVLPAAIPNLLVNGTTGIAVGMATNIAPHNLVEVVQALRHLITHPQADARRPDAVHPRPRPAHRRQDRRPRRHPRRLRDRPRQLPDAGHRPDRVASAARKGIVVTELPYGVGTEQVIERIKTLVQSKKLQGIADVKDLTDRAEGPAPGDRGQERLPPRGAARAALQAHADGGHLRHQHRRPGRRPAAHARPQGAAARSSSSTASRSSAAARRSAAARPPTGCTWSTAC